MLTATGPASGPALSFPFEAAPQPGRAIAVAPGVYWLRLPLPMSLDHINVWAIEDGAGWTLVDTGMQSRRTTAAWQETFGEALQGRPITRIICTHMHPDHIGMAGWLTRHFGCRLWITRLEYVTCRMLVADTGREAPEEALRFYRAAGWEDSAVEEYRARFGGFGRAVHALPDSYRRVREGEVIEIGGHAWHAVIGRGHSPEHLCLHCPDLKLLISGDQVLPRITSNVSVFPTEPDADPLRDWLESLDGVRRAVPDDVLVLPSHNEPFHGLHARIEQLIRGHEQKLGRLDEQLTAPKRAVDAFSLLFQRRISNEVLIMATGESIAHLSCLMHRGRIGRTTDEHGVHWYQRL